MKAVVYDSGEDRQSWVLGWFHQVYNKSNGNGSHYIVLVGAGKDKKPFMFHRMKWHDFLKVFFHVYSIDAACGKITVRRSSFSDFQQRSLPGEKEILCCVDVVMLISWSHYYNRRG